jgi:glucosylceramidase
MKGIRDSVSSSSFKYIEIDEDVSPTERPIAVTTRKAYSRVAVVGGGCIVFILFLLLSMRVAQVVLMPAIVVMQTSLLHDEDRLSLFDAKTMATRGFDVGLLAFGNTECSKLMKAIEIETMHQCNPPQVEDTSLITVDRDKRFQKVLGFGGAFTEAAAINFFKLPEEVQQKVVELYWSEDGIQYTLGRVPINSCDFSPESYSFDNIAGDTDVTYFDTELTRDSAFMMPLMRRANEEVAKWLGRDSSPAITIMNGLRDHNIGSGGIGGSNGLKLVASPWSPPAWMKQPIKEGAAQSMSGSAEPQGLIDSDEIKRAWALYVFILLYYCFSFLFLFVMSLSLSLTHLLLPACFSDMT